MDCLACRRSLLAEPRPRTIEQQPHLADCADCARFAQRLTGLERVLEDAVLVPVPDAIAARVLLERHAETHRRCARAAVFAGVFAIAALFGVGVLEAPALRETATVRAVGPAHPAIAAIAEVADEDGEPTARSPEQSVEMQDTLRRLGLTLKVGHASAYYLGRCHINATSTCEHIVLSSDDGYANVMLVSDYPLHERLLVRDRQMVALVSPVRDGAYIVVADSAKTAKRMEKLIVKG
jgi:hypothetical protein